MPAAVHPGTLAPGRTAKLPTQPHTPAPLPQVFGSSDGGKGSGGDNNRDGKGGEREREGDRRSSAGGRGGRGGRDGGDRRKSGGRGGGRGDGKDGKQGGGSVSEDLQKLVGLIKDKKFEPAIVFSFSRR